MSLSLPKHFFPWSLHVKAKAKSVGRPRGSTNREAYGAYGMGGFPLSPPAPWRARRPRAYGNIGAKHLWWPKSVLRKRPRALCYGHLCTSCWGALVFLSWWQHGARTYIYIYIYIYTYIYVYIIYIHVYMGPTGWRLPWRWDRGFPTTKEY